MAFQEQNIPDHNECVQRLREMMKDIEFAMLTTVDPDGSLHSRPMVAKQVNFDGDLWFFTGRSSGKIASIDRDAHVNVAFAEPSKNRYVSVSGRAELVEDRQKAAELWSPVYRAWFPEGLEDPNLALLRVRVESAEYWDSPSSKLVHLAGFAKAVVSGERYQPGEKEHGRTDFRH